MRERKTLEQMALEAQGRQPMTIRGKPADRCPYCGCGMFIDGVNRGGREILRYVECRNCKRRFKSTQPPATLLSEIADDEDNSAHGKPVLTLVRKSG